MNTKAHWETVYGTKAPTGVSWYQPEAALSLRLIRQAAPGSSARIIDVGGGASVLVDGLIAAGYRHVTVLDLSAAALESARRRMGSGADRVTWLEADILDAALARDGYDVWHDRAVFHFLTNPEDRRKYVAQVAPSVRAGGHVVMATFSDQGPTRCSGLDVVRYTPEALHREFGPGFTLVDSVREDHVTPAGMTQAFVYCLFRASEGLRAVVSRAGS